MFYELSPHNFERKQFEAFQNSSDGRLRDANLRVDAAGSSSILSLSRIHTSFHIERDMSLLGRSVTETLLPKLESLTYRNGDDMLDEIQLYNFGFGRKNSLVFVVQLCLFTGLISNDSFIKYLNKGNKQNVYSNFRPFFDTSILCI